MLVLPVVVFAVVTMARRGLRLRLNDRVHLARRLVEQRVVGARRGHVRHRVRRLANSGLLDGRLHGRAGRGRTHLGLLLALALLNLAPLRLGVDELVRRALAVATPLKIKIKIKVKNNLYERTRCKATTKTPQTPFIFYNSKTQRLK